MAYIANPVNFDGTNDYLTRGAGMTGAADSKLWTCSFWVRRTGGLGTSQRVFAPASPATEGANLTFNTSNLLNIQARNAASDAVALLIQTSAITDTAWHHVMFSVDMANAANRHLYVDGVSDLSVITYTDVSLDFTDTNWAIGGSTAGADKLQGDLADLQSWPGTHLDLSVEANQRLFISATGAPIDPATAAATLGSPLILLSGSTDTWHTNDGTGGGFTENGAFTDGSVALPADELGTIEIGAVEWEVQYLDAGNVDAAPSAGVLEITGLVPVIQASATVTPSASVLVITGLAPSALVGFTAEPAAGELELTGFAPTVDAAGNITIELDTGILEIVGLAPDVTATATVSPSTASVVITGFAPTAAVGAGVTAEPGAGSLEIAGLAPDVVASTTAAPTVGTIDITGLAPTVAAGAGVTVEPTAGAIELTGLAAAVSATVAVTPTSSSLVVTGFAPEVLTLADGTFQPGVGSLEVVGVLPTVSTSAQVEPTPGAVEITGLAPSVSAGTGVTTEPTAGNIELASFAPTVSRGTTAEPEAGAVEITGQAPATQSSHQLQTAAGSCVITGFAPSVIAGTGVILTTGTGSLVVVGNPAEFASHFTAVANTGELVVVGRIAMLGGDQIFDVPTSTLEIGSYPPFVVHLPVPGHRRFIVGERDRQFAVSGRRRVFRAGPGGGSEAA